MGRREARDLTSHSFPSTGGARVFLSRLSAARPALASSSRPCPCHACSTSRCVSAPPCSGFLGATAGDGRRSAILALYALEGAADEGIADEGGERPMIQSRAAWAT